MTEALQPLALTLRGPSDPLLTPTGSDRQFRVLPGFGLTLGYTLFYVSLIVLLPLSTAFVRSAELGPTQFWNVVTAPRVLASLRLSFGASFLAALINAV